MQKYRRTHKFVWNAEFNLVKNYAATVLTRSLTIRFGFYYYIFDLWRI